MQVKNFQLGAFLKQERERQQLSSRDLAKRTKRNGADRGVAASHINKIEKGRVHPTFQTLQKIVAALGLPLVIVLDGSKAAPDTVTILSTSEIAQALSQALNHEKLVQLLLSSQQLTDKQIEIVLGLARKISGATRPENDAGSMET